MNPFALEIDELKRLNQSLPDYLGSEVLKIVQSNDEVVMLLYSRRALELLVRQICKQESIKISDTIPLKGIIDKLNKEQKVPSNIITAMLNLNSISTYGAHPKEFEPRQVKSALNDLVTILEWFLSYSSFQSVTEKEEMVVVPDDSKTFQVNRNLKSLRISLAIILSVAIIFILLFDVFHIFQKDEFKALRDEEGRISVAVMPFQNLTNDSLWNIWQNGIQNELISKLSNSEELAILQYQTMFDLVNNSKVEMASFSPNLAAKLSKQVEAAVFVFGTIKKSQDKVRLNAQLIESESMKVYKSFEIDGNSEEDIFGIVDSLTFLIKSDLEIQAIEEKNKDIAPKGYRTKSVQAYRNLIEGINAFTTSDFESCIKLQNEALRLDSNFVSARITLAVAYGNSGNVEMAKFHVNKAYTQLENLSKEDRVGVLVIKALYEKDIKAMIKYGREYVELVPQKWTWYQQAWNYFKVENYEKVVFCAEKALEIDKKSGGNWKWLSAYTVPGRAYHQLGNHERENEVYEKGLAARPDHPYLIKHQVICVLSTGDTAFAHVKLKKLKALRKESGWKDQHLFNELGNIYRDAEKFNRAEDFYKKSIEKNSEYYWSRYNLIHMYFSNKENVEEGYEVLRTLEKDYPEEYQTIYLKGFAAYLQENYKEAKQLLEKAWELRSYYDHEHFKLLQEVEQKLAETNE